MRKIQQKYPVSNSENTIKVTIPYIYKVTANAIIYKQTDLTKEHFKSALYASVANFFVTKKKKKKS